MASAAPGGARGRRKQAKPQRKVELDVASEGGVQYDTVLTEIAATASSMSPDTNHNELGEPQKMLSAVHKEGIVAEDVLNGSNGLIRRPPVHEEARSGGEDDADNIEAYLRRSDTVVIFPAPENRPRFPCSAGDIQEAVETANERFNTPKEIPSLANGVTKEEGDDTSSSSEYFIKCPQCQKGFQSFQPLKEHMEAVHPEIAPENGTAATPSAVSPTPSLLGPAGPYSCSQCTATFTTKDLAEKHELMHSPNAQVSCKICNKTFANVYRLQRHMISHDESAVLRKFKCTECDKAFKFKHHLKEHIRIHSGEKPFECVNCGKRFSHSGSYSSHMTSKKCLTMNLKLGRTRVPNTGSLLDKAAPQNTRGPKRPPSNPLNNNIATTNHNAYMQILPKYTEAAAAFLANPTMHPFYMNMNMTPPGLLQTTNGHPLSPYSVPMLNHLLEQLQRTSPHKAHGEGDAGVSHEAKPEEKAEEAREENLMNKSSSSSCGDLVMDEEVEEKLESNEKTTNNGDLETVKRILETVNVSVTNQLLHANMQKFSDNSSDFQSVRSTHSPVEMPCSSCKRTFSSQAASDEHECERNEKSEGLAAKLEDAVASKSEPEINGHGSCNEDDSEYDKNTKSEEYELDSETVTTTDQLTEDGRKVRVRSLISDEQLKVLKDNYALNPRPKREELSKIAEQIGFPVRVVQVWFQNTRARDRREGRLIQVPYNTPPTLPRYPIPVVPSNPPYIHTLPHSPLHYQSEQPLDLSIKREHSRESSPSSSPQRPASTNHHSDSGEEVVNLIQKSSRSPTPFQHSSYDQYQASNCSSEPRRSPSPSVDFNNSSRLAQILAQPKLALSTMGLVPMERLMQFGHHDLPSLTQLMNNHISPGSEKRSWAENGYADEDDYASAYKRGKVAMKSLDSPMLGGQEPEIEGQFTCDQCDKAFSKQSSLARHKYEHSGQRPHKCDECPKAFKHKHHLTEHKRLHSGEKPFQCCKCLKRFSHSGSYSQHMNHRYSYCKPYRE